MVDYLPLESADLEEMLAHNEFWDRYGADDELLELSYLRDPIRRSMDLKLPHVTPELRADAEQADERYRARLDRLTKTASPADVTLAAIARARDAAAALVDEPDPANVLRGYHEADVGLTLLEGYLEEAVWAFDEYIDHQVDAERER